jgi:hypothetical protein
MTMVNIAMLTIRMERFVLLHSTAPTDVVVNLEKCNVYHYDRSGSDNKVVVLGSTGGSLPDTNV